MAKGDAAKVAKAGVPNELYDTLDPTAQDVYDLIGSQGFRPDRNDKGEWIGLSISGDDKLGPYESLSVLADEVQRFVAKKAATNGDTSSNEVEIYETSKGRRLPGIEVESVEVETLKIGA